MSEYIDREAFIADKRTQYCADCNRRKGMKNGKYKTLYEIGEAPCRACGIDDMLNDVEDFPAADVRPVVRGKWVLKERAHYFKCSICKTPTPYRFGYEGSSRFYNFCPNCGAEMREEG